MYMTRAAVDENWENGTEQTGSCPRGCRVSPVMGEQFEGSPEPLVYHSSYGIEGFKGSVLALSYYGERPSISGSRCNIFLSACRRGRSQDA